MTVAPLPQPRADRLATAAHARPAPTRRSLSVRRRVRWAKRLLPVFALLLLSSVALWPEIARQLAQVRVGIHQGGFSADMETGKLLNVRYHGVDARNRPYTVTADEAAQVGPERINLVQPKGDMVSEAGSWTFGEAERGVYMQHTGEMDLSGNVTLYRDSGVTLHTAVASMDLKTGAGAGDAPTHTEGPFGTLDSQGFALTDKGAVIQFYGRSRLLLNEQHP